MRKRDLSAATEVAAAVTVATALREARPAVTDRQVKMVRLFGHVFISLEIHLCFVHILVQSPHVQRELFICCFFYTVISECCRLHIPS